MANVIIKKANNSIIYNNSQAKGPKVNKYKIVDALDTRPFKSRNGRQPVADFMIGFIPPELEALDQLEVLNLSSNQLKGERLLAKA